VISEAVDSKNTSVTLSGRKQCDEDDYGYESKASADFYDKLMSKYEADPDDPMAKFSKSKARELKDIQGAKDRMKQALRREEEDISTPGKRRRRKKETSVEDEGFIDSSVDRHKSNLKKEDLISKDKKRKEEEARRKRIANAKKAPPPVDFNSLLKLANEKKDIPVKIEKKVEKKDGEFGDRPMTKREKEEFIRDNEARLRREGKLPPKERSPAVMEKKSRGSSEEKIERMPERPPKIRAEPGPSFHSAVLKTMPPPEKRKHDPESDTARQMKELEMKMKELDKKKEELETKSKVEEYNRRKRLEYERKKAEFEREKRHQQLAEKQERRKLEQDKKKLEDMQARYKEMQRQLQEKEQRLSSGGSSTKRDIHSVESRHFPGERKRRDDRGHAYGRGGGGGGMRIESDSEEYDSEMDDFIDDTDAKVDIGAEIRNIFGYDKRKYRDEDDFDDRSMENNKFSSIMMEEARSARIGRQEDLEDIRREEEELKRKKRRR